MALSNLKSQKRALETPIILRFNFTLQATKTAMLHLMPFQMTKMQQLGPTQQQRYRIMLEQTEK